jgi:PhnB protein
MDRARGDRRREILPQLESSEWLLTPMEGVFMAVKPVPQGYHTVTPYLIVEDGAAAIEFYKKAFGAKELLRFPGPGGKLMHGEIQIGDSPIMLADEFPEMGYRSPKSLGGSATSIMLYVEDVDASFAQAVAAGAKVRRAVEDQFYGDRCGTVDDPFGHVWTLGTHKEDVAPEEMNRRFEAIMKRQASA